MPRLPLYFILATMVIDFIGIGLIFPVMPGLLKDITGLTLAESAVWGGVLATSFAIMQFLCGPVVGNLSDAFGRRPTLLIALAVMALDYVVMASAQTIWLLLVTRIVAGMTAATHSTAMAYVADMARAEERARYFGYVGAAFGAGFVIGPMLGGLLATIDLRAPFWAAAGLAAANFVFGWFVMPESLAPAKRRRLSWARANPLSAFAAIGRLPGLGRLLIVLGIYEFAQFAYPAIWAFYGEAAFGWNATMIGVSLAVFGLGMVLVQAGLVGPAIRALGARGTVIAGMGIDIVVAAIYAVLSSGPVALGMTLVAALAGVVMPALQSIMSATTPDDQQGELQGVIASVVAVSTIAAPLAMTLTFSAFTREGAAIYMPGAPFALTALLLAAGLALFLATPSADPHRPDPAPGGEEGGAAV